MVSGVAFDISRHVTCVTVNDSFPGIPDVMHGRRASQRPLSISCPLTIISDQVVVMVLTRMLY